MARRTETLDKTQLLSAAQRLFLHWGYSGTSTAALAEDLGVTKAALYYHFPDKEALFLAVVEGYLDAVAADLADIASLFEGEDDDGALAALAEVFLSRHETSAQMQQLAFQESRHLSPEGTSTLSRKYHASLVKPVSDLLDLARERGWLRPTLEDEPAAIWLFMGLLSAFLQPEHATAMTVHHPAEAFVRLLRGALDSSYTQTQPDPRSSK